ncbi:MAG: DUF1028 domain-containing protein, partial [Kiloniellales bacterium]|nr:DUF1028 domain-containing protein [Kiloniellales bacterium]
ITARCAETGAFGLAVSSSSPAVAARCIFARAKAGAVATQNITDPSLGPQGLDLMADGKSAAETLKRIVSKTPNIQYRQLALIDKTGLTATYSGSETLGIHATAEGTDCVAAGNLLDNTGVPSAMVSAFEATRGLLGDRLIAAMKAAESAGGEAGPVHSAGLLIVEAVSWPTSDLRVDWTDDDPITDLEQLWQLWKPQAADYVTRALNPSGAPSYGVPGDD